MKQTVLGTIVVTITLIVASILFSIDSRTIRQQEIEDALTEALESSANELFINQAYTAENADEFVADLIQALSVQIDSNSTVSVRIIDLDSEKGIASIEAVETYKYPNGKEGTVKSVKTVIMEQPENNPDENDADEYEVTFYLSESELYKKYVLPENVQCIIPDNPKYEGKTFRHWTTADGTAVQLENIEINSNLEFTAVFE